MCPFLTEYIYACPGFYICFGIIFIFHFNTFTWQQQTQLAELLYLFQVTGFSPICSGSWWRNANCARVQALTPLQAPQVASEGLPWH